METLSDGLKKIMLAGIGALATTAEKSQELLDDMVEKGELTVEQGKALNKELKHAAEKKKEEKESPRSDSASSDSDKKEDKTEKADEDKTRPEKESFDQWLSGLSSEDLTRLKEALDKAAAEKKD